MRRFYIFLIMAVFMAVFHSCELERSSKGNLYGFWHLTAVDTLDGGVADMSGQLFFYAIQARLIELSDRSDEYSAVIGRFERVGDSLFVERLHYNDREKEDAEVTDLARLRPWGINSFSPRLRIEHLSSGRLILSNGRLKMSLEKF